MDEKKYKVTCGGKEVEVTEEVYKLCVTDLAVERRKMQRRKTGRIEVDSIKEEVHFIECKEDSIDRIIELGIEMADNSFDQEAIDTEIMLHQALESLSETERYILEGIYFRDKSECEIAAEISHNQQFVSYHKKKALHKLYEFLKK